jgi:hypothetical protein
VIAALIREAAIPVPPLLTRNIDQLYLLGDAGPSLLQLVSIVLQYDDMLDTLAGNVAQEIVLADPGAHAASFANHLTVIGQLLREADERLGPIHDGAVPSSRAAKNVG